MEPGVKVKLTQFTCRRCKSTFKSYFYWYEHVRQEHGSVFIKSSGNISSSSENTISLVQYLKTTTEEQTFVESTSSSIQDDKGELSPVIENQTNLSTLPQNEASGATTSQDLDFCEQTSFNKTSDTSVETDTNFSSDQGAKTPAASGNPKNEPSTPSEEAEGNTAAQTSSNQTSGTSLKSDSNFSSGPAKTLLANSDPKTETCPYEEAGDNTAAQTSSNQTSETSLESDTHLSSDHTAKTLSASSDPKTEPSTPCQQTEDNTAAQTSSNQTNLTSLESDTNFSSGQGGKALIASSDPKNEPSTPSEEAEGNTAAQTSSNQTSETSLESDTHFSSGEGAMTHNPDVHAETSSTNEPSTSYQHSENKTATGLFSLYKESLSREVETLTAKNEPSTPCQEAGDNTAAELISLNQEKLLQETETLVDRLFDRFCVLDGLEEMSTNEDRTWMRWIREIIFQMKEYLFEAGQILMLASWTDRAIVIDEEISDTN